MAREPKVVATEDLPTGENRILSVIVRQPGTLPWHPPER